MARFIVKKFGYGWYSASGALRRSLGWSILEVGAIQRARNSDGSYVSGRVSIGDALRIASAFEQSGCEVDVEE